MINLDREAVRNNFIIFFNSFKERFDYTDEDVATILRLSKGQFLKILNGKKDLGIDAVANLIIQYNLCFESIVEGKVDFEALFQHHMGNKSYVPLKYRLAARSKKRAALYMLEFIEHSFSLVERKEIEKSLQLDSSFFVNPDEEINTVLSMDICSLVDKKFKDRKLLTNMGENFYFQNAHNSIGQELESSRSFEELCEKFIQDTTPKYIEKNFNWVITYLDSRTCEIHGVPHPEIALMLGRKNVVRDSMCVLREGVMSTVPMFAHIKGHKTTKIACINWGDKSCGYKLEIPQQKLRRPYESSQLHLIQ